MSNVRKSKALTAVVLLLAVMVFASMMPLKSHAAGSNKISSAATRDKQSEKSSIINKPTSGSFGSLKWDYDTSTETLTLTGSGKMPDREDSVPWEHYSTHVKKIVIGNGITNIGDLVFEGMFNVTSVTLPNGVKTIGVWAFDRTDLTKVTLPSSVTSVEACAFPDETEVICPKSLTKMEDGSYMIIQKVTVSVKQNYKNAFKILSMVNAQRKKAGLSALKMDKDLLDAAMLRAGEISIRFSHDRPCGLYWFSISEKMCAENITTRMDTPKEAMDGWMDSLGHRANILDPDYKTIGIGAVVVPGAGCQWVQCFGRDVDPSAVVTADKYNNKTVTQNIKVVKSVISKILFYDGSSTIRTGSAETPCLVINCVDVANKYVKVTSSAPDKLKVGKNNKMIALKKGKAKITVQLKDYPSIKVVKTVTVKVRKLAKTSITSVSSSGKKIRLSWKKKSGVQGYQIRYSLKKNFKNAKIKKITGKAVTKATLKGLKKNRKYYAGVRSYKKQNGVMLYSNWSKTKAVKVK